MTNDFARRPLTVAEQIEALDHQITICQDRLANTPNREYRGEVVTAVHDMLIELTEVRRALVA